MLTQHVYLLPMVCVVARHGVSLRMWRMNFSRLYGILLWSGKDCESIGMKQGSPTSRRAEASHGVSMIMMVIRRNLSMPGLMPDNRHNHAYTIRPAIAVGFNSLQGLNTVSLQAGFSILCPTLELGLDELFHADSLSGWADDDQDINMKQEIELERESWSATARARARKTLSRSPTTWTTRRAQGPRSPSSASS